MNNKEIIKKLKDEYTEKSIREYKSEAVYDYISEDEAEDYGGDLEAAYDDQCTGEAIENDIMDEMEVFLEARFGIDVWEDGKEEIVEAMKDRVRLVFPDYSTPTVNEINAKAVQDLMANLDGEYSNSDEDL